MRGRLGARNAGKGWWRDDADGVREFAVCRLQFAGAGVRALTLTQPWATLVAQGQKRWETRRMRKATEGAETGDGPA